MKIIKNSTTMYVPYMIEKIEKKQERLIKLINMAAEYDKEIIDELGHILKQNGINENECICSTLTHSFQLISENKQLNDVCESLYKRLLLLSHPDKGNTTDDFYKIQSAYQNNDYWLIIKFGSMVC